MSIVVDTYAWIEVFLGSQKGAIVKEALEEAADVYTPDVVLAEIARKYLREGIEETLVGERLRVVSSASVVTPIDSEVALSAGRVYSELVEKARKEKLRDPSLFDAIVLATARSYQARLVTGDEHFRNLPEAIWI